MYKHILVPTDGTALSQKAVKTATELARGMKAKVTAVHVIPPYVPPVVMEAAIAYTVVSPAEYRQTTERQAQKMLDKVKASVEAKKVACDVAYVNNAQPWEAIIKLATGRKCDLIVMASHGRRGLEGLLLGSETNKVLTHSKTPVLVCR